MKPERELRGDGLLLRPLGAKDLPRIVEACSDPLFARWLPWLRGRYTLERAEEFVTDFASSNWESGQPIWALCFEADPDSLIGVLDLRDRGQGEWEIGYWMRPEVRGRGLMIGMELIASDGSREPAARLCDALITRAFQNGVLLLSCGVSTVRFMPPLTVSFDEIDEVIECLRYSLDEALQGID